MLNQIKGDLSCFTMWFVSRFLYWYTWHVFWWRMAYYRLTLLDISWWQAESGLTRAGWQSGHKSQGRSLPPIWTICIEVNISLWLMSKSNQDMNNKILSKWYFMLGVASIDDVVCDMCGSNVLCIMLWSYTCFKAASLVILNNILSIKHTYIFNASLHEFTALPDLWLLYET